MKAGGKAIAHVADVTKKSDVIALYDAAERDFGGVDISVQNAGVITIVKIEDMTEKEWNTVLAVNTTGVFLCCQEAIARMRKHKRGGRLINTASGQARQGFIYTPHYAASKFGVVGITQSLAKEVAKEGITVNAFCPGIIETDMWAYNDQAWGKLLGEYKPGELMAEWVRGIPMGRAGSGEDVAGLVAFLASDDATGMWGRDEVGSVVRLEAWNRPIHRIRGPHREARRNVAAKLRPSTHALARAPKSRPANPIHRYRLPHQALLPDSRSGLTSARRGGAPAVETPKRSEASPELRRNAAPTSKMPRKRLSAHRSHKASGGQAVRRQPLIADAATRSEGSLPLCRPEGLSAAPDRAGSMGLLWSG
jgi:meso-butanediol dehydrogenase/(S,S)-butanediol dehydrogenase/diacetyl reductase